MKDYKLVCLIWPFHLLSLKIYILSVRLSSFLNRVTNYMNNIAFLSHFNCNLLSLFYLYTHQPKKQILTLRCFFHLPFRARTSDKASAHKALKLDSVLRIGTAPRVRTCHSTYLLIPTASNHILRYFSLSCLIFMCFLHFVPKYISSPPNSRELWEPSLTLFTAKLPVRSVSTDPITLSVYTLQAMIN